jgi:hypothetical protein
MRERALLDDNIKDLAYMELLAGAKKRKAKDQFESIKQSPHSFDKHPYHIDSPISDSRRVDPMQSVDNRDYKKMTMKDFQSPNTAEKQRNLNSYLYSN